MRFGKHFFVFLLLAIGLGVGCYALTIEERMAKTEQDIQMIKNRLEISEGRAQAPDVLDAIKAGDLAKVKYLIETGKFPVNKRCSDSATALIEAAKANKLDIVMYLLSKGAFVDQRGGRGETALDYAKQNKNEGMIELLQRHGAK